MRRAPAVGLLLAGSVLGLGACTSARAGRSTTLPGRPPSGLRRRRLRRGPRPRARSSRTAACATIRRPTPSATPGGSTCPTTSSRRGSRSPRSTAYVVGHRAGEVGSKPCQVAAVALPSGRTRAFAARLDPPGGPRRHGATAGTAAARRSPTPGCGSSRPRGCGCSTPRGSASDPVLRVWRLGEGVRGSTLAATGGRLVVAGYRPDGPGRARWYDESALLRAGATTLVEGAAGPGEVAMERSTRVPAAPPGPAFTRAGVPWFVSSRHRLRGRAPRGPPARLRARRGGPGGRPTQHLDGQRGQRLAVPRPAAGRSCRGCCVLDRDGRRGRRPGELRALSRAGRRGPRRAPACPAEKPTPRATYPERGGRRPGCSASSPTRDHPAEAAQWHTVSSAATWPWTSAPPTRWSTSAARASSSTSRPSSR